MSMHRDTIRLAMAGNVPAEVSMLSLVTFYSLSNDHQRGPHILSFNCIHCVYLSILGKRDDLGSWVSFLFLLRCYWYLLPFLLCLLAYLLLFNHPLSPDARKLFSPALAGSIISLMGQWGRWSPDGVAKWSPFSPRHTTGHGNHPCSAPNHTCTP